MNRSTVSRSTRAPRVPNLLPIREVAKRRPYLSEATLRDKWYHARPRLSATGSEIPPNGWAACFVKLGRQVLVDIDVLDALVEQHRAAPTATLSDAQAAA